MDKRTFAIIPARGGSKQIPNKNLLNFSGKPLLAWSIIQAKQSKYIDAVYVSSDCEQILACAKEYGAIPLRRPAAYATDTAASELALSDALAQIQQMTRADYQYFVFLQATSPLRKASDIDACIEHKFTTHANCVFSAVESGDLCVWQRAETVLPFTYQPGQRLPRQKSKPLLIENGSIYVTDVATFIKHNNRLGDTIEACVFPAWQVHEIDTMEDVIICEALFNYYRLASKSKELLTAYQPQLIVYDFDGVMTNNRAFVNQDGIEAVAVNRSDGWAIARLKEAGKRQLILSTEANKVVSVRAKKLNIDVIDSCENKALQLSQFCRNNAIALHDVLFVGNEVNDLETMQVVGYSVCPSDAHPDILAIADHITKAKGGEGVIRELFDYLNRGR